MHIHKSFLCSPFSFGEASLSSSHLLMSPRIKVHENQCAMDEVFQTSKARCLGHGRICLPPKWSQARPFPRQPPPSRQVLGCSVCFEGIWERKQMSYQKCFFLFGGRMREQRGLLNLYVWRWKDVGSGCQITSFLSTRLPWAGSAFQPGLANQVSTTTISPARNLLCVFNFNSLESLGYALKP